MATGAFPARRGTTEMKECVEDGGSGVEGGDVVTKGSDEQAEIHANSRWGKDESDQRRQSGF